MPTPQHPQRAWVCGVIGIGAAVFCELLIELDLIPFHRMLPKTGLAILASDAVQRLKEQRPEIEVVW